MSENSSRQTDIWRLIVVVSSMVAFVVVAAVLVFQIIEFLYYRKPPSVWPTP